MLKLNLIPSTEFGKAVARRLKLSLEVDYKFLSEGLSYSMIQFVALSEESQEKYSFLISYLTPEYESLFHHEF